MSARRAHSGGMAGGAAAAGGPTSGRPTPPRPLAVIGAGQHARVVIDAARSRPEAWVVIGVVDPDPTPATLAMGVGHLGDDDAFLARLTAVEPGERPALVLGIGGIADVGLDRAAAPDVARRRLTGRYEGQAEWASVVHSTAHVAPGVVLGPGTVVMAGAVVNPGATLGRHVVVNTGAIVEHDVIVEDYAQLAPAAAIGGGCRIGPGAFVGLGARVRDHVTIGPGAVVGMGAAVVADVPPGATVGGVPARPLGRDAGTAG